MGDKRFSEVVDWNKHIQPYRLVQFVAGVGAGKNHWVENDLMKKMRVLLITSRKAKVKETSHKLGIASKLDLNAFEKRDLGTFLGDEKNKYQNCVCNNSHIEKYWKYQFNLEDEKTHLWKYFDIIVVDEAHSLATDATFSDAPFHLYSFLNYVFKQKSIKLIFMTATHKPILDIVHTENKADRKLWDLRKECVNILPNKIHIDIQENILKEIMELYQNKRNKVIYFVNSIPSMKAIITNLVENGIPENKITVSYSKSNKNVDLPEKIKKSKTTTEKHLREHEDLPKNKFILISTSKNKEGINIDNKEVNWYMYVESHYNDECNQMWGRVRSGVQKFMIDFSAQPHSKIFCDDEPSYIMSEVGIKCATKTLECWYAKQKGTISTDENAHKNEEYYRLKKCIEDIEKRFDFLRYDVIKREFIMYKEKVIGCQNHAKAVSNFKVFVKMRLGKTNVMVHAPFELPCVVYPSILKLYEQPQKLNHCEIKKKLKELFNLKGWLNKAVMTKKDVELLRDFIYKLGITQKNGKPYSQINPAIEKYGFKYEKGHHKGALGKIIELKK